MAPSNGASDSASAPRTTISAPAPTLPERRVQKRSRSDTKSPRSVRVLGRVALLVVAGGRAERIAEIAFWQRGRVARHQLSAAGLSVGEIRTLVRRGQLIRRLRGVYAVGHAAPVALSAATEALLAVGPQAALSHSSAARLWGLPDTSDGDDRDDRDGIDGLNRLGAVEITAPSGARIPGLSVHRSRILTARDVRIRDGLPVTAPAWTLLDLSGRLDDRPLERAFDHLLIHRMIRPVEVHELLARIPGRPGRGRLVALLERERGGGITRSEAEERMLALIRGGQLPEPELNVRWGGWEIDFLWREARLAVEVDGFRFHSTRASFERDRRKDAELTAAGITVIRLTWWQLQHEPLAVIARLSGLLAQRI